MIFSIIFSKIILTATYFRNIKIIIIFIVLKLEN
jgi:hypothetical protein